MIELVISLMIVGILSVIAVPSYKAYTQRNLETTAISDIKAIEWRLKAIMAENPTALPADLAAINTGNVLHLKDPWGNAYRYLPLYGLTPIQAKAAGARKNKSDFPITSDFDLYSMGPDGDSRQGLQNAVSRDDIIRANDGAFIGKASTYDP